MQYVATRPRFWVVAALFAGLCGYAGVHDMYLRRWGWFIAKFFVMFHLMLFSGVVAAVLLILWGWVDLAVILVRRRDVPGPVVPAQPRRKAQVVWRYVLLGACGVGDFYTFRPVSGCIKVAALVVPLFWSLGVGATGVLALFIYGFFAFLVCVVCCWVVALVQAVWVLRGVRGYDRDGRGLALV